MKRRWIVGALAACLLLAAGSRSSALAGEVGNELTPRDAATDGATDVFYSNFFAAPYADQVSGVNVFYQGQAGNTFQFFQLRPTGAPNQFNVVYNSGVINPSGTPNTVSTLAFPNGPTNVLAGDIFAHYGTGIPYSDAGGTNANQLQAIYYSSPAAPIAGNNITLDSGAFPKNNGFIRDYASSVTMSSFTEQVGFGTVNRAAIDGADGVLGVLTNDPFTQAGTVTKWHIYSDDTVAINRSITPLIFRPDGGGGYDVIGEGTPRQTNALGLQMFDFGLVSGTAEVLAGDMVGWWDGSGGAQNLGVAEWDTFGSEVIPLWDLNVGVNVGDNFFPGAGPTPFHGNFNRQYSINFTTTAAAAVPEPAAIAGWIIVGACGIAFARRRRKNK